IETTEPVAEWWSTFNDSQLDGLVKRAVQNNLDLQLATARIAEARAVRGVVRSGLFPSVGAGVSATRNRQRVIAPGGEVGEAEFNNFEGQLDASWELDVFGRIRSGVKAATADTVAAEESRRAVLVSLLGELGRSYANLRGLQLRLVVAEKNIRTQEETLEVTQARSKAGLATDLDVERALAQLETTRSAVPSLKSGIQTEIHRLSVLLGEDPGALADELSVTAPVPATPPGVPVGLRTELLERRPDLRESEAEIVAATARVGEAKAEYFPRFVLFGTAGRQAAQLHDLSLGVGNFFSAGPAISVPIFTGGRIRSNIRIQDARQQQSVLRYRSAVLSALEETENALVNYSNEQSRRERLENAVHANEEAVTLSNDRYRAGLTDFLSVLDAQRELYANEDLLAQSRTSQTLDLIALYKALGGGWQPFSQP
ncbi:MAG TPA: efflux transporter outer membrane subunit, partial [Nitrospira sp.]|nr:efflux transporter outer membrane subunit [Nitrospira sp.]